MDNDKMEQNNLELDIKNIDTEIKLLKLALLKLKIESLINVATEQMAEFKDKDEVGYLHSCGMLYAAKKLYELFNEEKTNEV